MLPKYTDFAASVEPNALHFIKLNASPNFSAFMITTYPLPGSCSVNFKSRHGVLLATVVWYTMLGCESVSNTVLFVNHVLTTPSASSFDFMRSS